MQESQQNGSGIQAHWSLSFLKGVDIIYITWCPQVEWKFAEDSKEHLQHSTCKLNMTLMRTT